jgi:hypothetical protein
MAKTKKTPSGATPPQVKKDKLVEITLREALAAFGSWLAIVKAGCPEEKKFEVTCVGPEVTPNHWAAALAKWTPAHAATHIPNDGYNDELWFKDGGLRTGVRLQISAQLLAQLRQRRRSVPAAPAPEVTPSSRIVGSAPNHHASTASGRIGDEALKRLSAIEVVRTSPPATAVDEDKGAVSSPAEQDASAVPLTREQLRGLTREDLVKHSQHLVDHFAGKKPTRNEVIAAAVDTGFDPHTTALMWEDFKELIDKICFHLRPIGVRRYQQLFRELRPIS